MPEEQKPFGAYNGPSNDSAKGPVTHASLPGGPAQTSPQPLTAQPAQGGRVPPTWQDSTNYLDAVTAAAKQGAELMAEVVSFINGKLEKSTLASNKRISL